MKVKSVKEGVRELAQYLPSRLPATGWYFTAEEPRGSITLDDNGWTCMFKLIERVANVLIPYAAGCQGIWTIPYKEAFQESPRAVVGAIDPVVRHYLPPDTLSFSMPMQRFVEMSINVPDSFLKREPWTRLIS